MERLYVRLSDADLEKLVRIARAQRRHPGDEAGLILSRVLRAETSPVPDERTAEAERAGDAA